tara:strand:+ start:354 stop:683 length:330 start_codon:yes stop_codon:yes gene_type:complete
MANPVASGWTDDGNMYRADNLLSMNSTAAGVVDVYFKSWNGHGDGPDDVELTVVSSGDDEADRVNRLAAMDAIVSKANTVNKQGFVVAFSEIENIKPGGISSIAMSLNS